MMILRNQRELSVDGLTISCVLIVIAYFISIGGFALVQLGGLR